jgi:hypothetical protein
VRTCDGLVNTEQQIADAAVIITTYNDLGDKASETTTTVTNPDADREYGLTETGH